MEILNHLSNEDLRDLLLESDRQHLRSVLEALPGWARASADRPAEFWERQRTAIMSRISTTDLPTGSRSPALAWAIAAVVLAIASLMLSTGPRSVPAPQAQADPDRELLLEVERAMQSGGPNALEPAALLAEEIGEYEKTHSGLQHPEEVNHEE